MNIQCVCGLTWSQHTHTVCPRCFRWPTRKSQRGMGNIDFTGLLWLGMVIGVILGIGAWKLIGYLWQHVSVGWN